MADNPILSHIGQNAFTPSSRLRANNTAFENFPLPPCMHFRRNLQSAESNRALLGVKYRSANDCLRGCLDKLLEVAGT